MVKAATRTTKAGKTGTTRKTAASGKIRSAGKTEATRVTGAASKAAKPGKTAKAANNANATISKRKKNNAILPVEDPEFSGN